MTTEFGVAIIGLDTSHSIEFTRLIQGDAPAEHKIDGLRVLRCMRFPSPFHPEEGQDKRQAQLEQWEVEVTRSLEEAVHDADGLLLELNDPAMHLEFFEKVAGFGKPIFLDKPLAGAIADGRKIAAIAKEKGTKVWSSSSLRFIDGLVEALEEAPDALLCNAYGPLGKAQVGSDLIWYGVHTIEMIEAIMGRGAKSVWAKADEKGILQVIYYHDGRRAVAECNKNAYFYGGRVQSAEKVRAFDIVSTANIYRNLLLRIRSFFIEGTIPVPMEDSLEILSIMDAAERSLASGAEEKLAL